MARTLTTQDLGTLDRIHTHLRASDYDLDDIMQCEGTGNADLNGALLTLAASVKAARAAARLAYLITKASMPEETP